MQIFLTKRAENHLDKIVANITTNWGQRVTHEFINKVDNIFTLLKNYPKMGHLEYKDIYGFQITSQTKILYRIKKDKIIILAFFDVRQNPISLFQNKR